ncbi:MAG: glycosyltransferase, partial [Actinomycetota bacterium]
MRILQLHAGYRFPAGEDTVVAAEAEVLRRGGHDVVQHVAHNPATSRNAVRVLAKSLRNRSQHAAVTELIRAHRPDVAHLHNTWFALSTSVIDAVADTGTPLVMTIHNYRLGCLNSTLFRGDSVCTACVGRLPIAGVLHGCYRDSRLLSAVAATEVASSRRRDVHDRVDRFVAPSRFMADRLVDIGVPTDRLVIKPHFTDDPGRRAAPPSASSEVVFIGRLAPGKGLETLLRAWELFDSRSDAGLHLTIIGDGPLAPTLREAAPRGVHFGGWIAGDEVRRRLLGARAFVFPSEWYEPFGMVLLEAMSAGLPIVSTTASDAPRITAMPPELIAPGADERAVARCLALLED